MTESGSLGSTSQLDDRKSPYVGPRPFKATDPFFGREREATGVVNTLLSSRILLLHSPSGAGKTSLVQASVVPAFRNLGFAICATTTPEFSALRVNLPPTDDAKPPNRYVYSVVNGLVGHLLDRSTALTTSIPQAMETFDSGREGPRNELVVIDQLEEILTLNPGDHKGHREFFKQLGEALDQDHRWALLAMREDYIGGLDRFQPYLPGQLRSTYRLDFLDERAALRAVKEPARRSGVEFEDDAAELMITELLQTRADAHNASSDPVRYPYVEPVLLQVVCDGLWRKLRKRAERAGDPFQVVTTKDVSDFRPFSKALSKYYRNVVREVAAGDPTAERVIRDWVGSQLIASPGLRRPTRSTPAVSDPDAAVRTLQSRYLIRDDPRPGGTWLELSHDMLIHAIQEKNDDWRVAKLESWQLKAEQWHRSDHDKQYLLGAADYRVAKELSKNETTSVEDSFLEESHAALAAESTLSKLEDTVGILGFVLALSLMVNLVFLIQMWRGS